MLVGAITVIVWKQFVWLGLYEIIPGFLFACIAIVAGSLLGEAPSKTMLERFREAEGEYNTPAELEGGAGRRQLIEALPFWQSTPSRRILTTLLNPCAGLAGFCAI